MATETPETPKFELKRLNPVALWSYNVQADTCSICRGSLMDLCISCQSNMSSSEECNVAWGECNHAFHAHCITDWLKTRAVCPLDQKQWNYARIDSK